MANEIRQMHRVAEAAALELFMLWHGNGRCGPCQVHQPQVEQNPYDFSARVVGKCGHQRVIPLSVVEGFAQVSRDSDYARFHAVSPELRLSTFRRLMQTDDNEVMRSHAHCSALGPEVVLHEPGKQSSLAPYVQVVCNSHRCANPGPAFVQPLEDLLQLAENPRAQTMAERAHLPSAYINRIEVAHQDPDRFASKLMRSFQEHQHAVKPPETPAQRIKRQRDQLITDRDDLRARAQEEQWSPATDWRKRAENMGLDPDQVQRDMDRWRGIAANEGLRPGSTAFNDRVGQLIYAELQSARRESLHYSGLARQRAEDVETFKGAAVDAAEQAQRELEDYKDELMNVFFEGAAERDGDEPMPAPPTPQTPDTRRFREDLVTTLRGGSAVERAPAFKFTRGVQVVVDGDYL